MKEKIKFTELQKFFELLSLIILVVLYGYLFFKWPHVPARIPSHFNASGTVDSWSGKGSLLAMPIIGTVLYALITVVSFFPQIWNMPVKVTGENKIRVYTLARTMLCTMKIVIVSTFSYISYCMAALKPLGALFLPIILIAIFGTMAVFIAKIMKAAKPKE